MAEKRPWGAPRDRVRGTASCPCPGCGGPSRVAQTYRPEDGAVRRRRYCVSEGCSVSYFFSLERAVGVDR